MKLYSNATFIICIWITSVLTIFYFSFSSLPKTNLFPNEFLKSLANWDGGHYLGIAQNGYALKSQYVFFPLYPILINLLTRITGDYLISGILISFLSLILAANIFYHVTAKDFGKAYAQRALLALLFFPLSFHFLTVYTESLFFLLAASTFLFARKKNYFFATATAALASATRLSGLAVSFSLIIPIFLLEGINKKNWIVILSPLGFLFYSIYLYIHTGDFFYFAQAESNFWHGGLVFPGSALIHSFKQLMSPNFIVNNFRNLLDFVFASFGILLIWRIFKTLSLDYAIFSIVSFSLTLFSPTIVAIPRYLLTIFPIFIILSFHKNQYVNLAYQIICLMLLPIYAVLFINGYWVS